MSIQNARRLETTRTKLAFLEAQLEELKAEPVINAQIRELSRRSFVRLINQLKEEIIRYEAHAPSKPS